MEETGHYKSELVKKKKSLNQEDDGPFRIESEKLFAVEPLISKLRADSPDFESESSEISSFKKKETEHYESPTNFTKKKKSPNQANDNISKLRNEVLSSGECPVLKCQGDYSDLESEIDFSLAKKKKKKKSVLPPENKVVATDDECCSVPLLLDIYCSISDTNIINTNSDYPYEYLLSRAFDLMREKNPNIDEATRKKLILKPPQVLRAGTKKTSFANFLELCKIMRRSPQHVQSFLIVELGTNGSIDGNGQLVIKGKFQQKQIESVLRRYIKEYVTCHTCHSPDTVLLKQTRLCFLQCEVCGSRCSVPTIKSGFHAVISKRAAIRDKIN